MYSSLTLAAALTDSLLYSFGSKGHLFISISAWKMIGWHASTSTWWAIKTCSWLTTMSASCKPCTSCPNLEEIYKIASFCNFMDISRPKSTVNMNKLIHLKWNESTSNSEFSFEFTHDALKLFLRIIYHYILFSAISIWIKMVMVIMISCSYWYRRWILYS